MEWYWIVLICVGWYAIGFFGHWWWWTKNYDYEVTDLFIGLFVGLLGLLAWLLGFWNQYEINKKVLFKQR